jgi:hypothetical protein
VNFKKDFNESGRYKILVTSGLIHWPDNVQKSTENEKRKGAGVEFLNVKLFCFRRTKFSVTEYYPVT